VISLVFLLLFCWSYMCFMTVAMYGFHHVFTCKGIDNVFYGLIDDDTTNDMREQWFLAILR